MATSDLYPCKGTPKHCGRSIKLDLHDGRQFICAYPECESGSWLAGRPISNKGVHAGQFFDAIMYRGSDEEMANCVYNHLNGYKTRSIRMPLQEASYKLRFTKVEMVQMNGVYQVEITGELE
jgi:hypothetical protein